MIRFKDHKELTAYLNGLSSGVWKSILYCKHIGGDERVIQYLRRECGRDLDHWNHEELTEYLVAHDLKKDFLSVGQRECVSNG